MGTVGPGVRNGLRGLTGLWSRPRGGITASTKTTDAVTGESQLYCPNLQHCPASNRAHSAKSNKLMLHDNWVRKRKKNKKN